MDVSDGSLLGVKVNARGPGGGYEDGIGGQKEDSWALEASESSEGGEDRDLLFEIPMCRTVKILGQLARERYLVRLGGRQKEVSKTEAGGPRESGEDGVWSGSPMIENS